MQVRVYVDSDSRLEHILSDAFFLDLLDMKTYKATVHT